MKEFILLQPGEEIRHIVGYEDLYSITSYGRVYSHKRVVKCSEKGYRSCGGRYLKLRLTKKSYLYVQLYKNNKGKTYKIHRLVSQAFILNPLSLPEINHKDGNKQNNYAGTTVKNYIDGNLEWCNHEKNMSHASKNKLYTHKYHSEFYGVSYDRSKEHKNKPWFAQIRVDKKRIYLGSYKTELEAAIIYNNYVVDYILDRPLNIF